MNRFLQDLKQPYWWIAVIVVGLCLNVLASYIRQWIDRGTLRIFSTLKRRTERRRKRIEDAAAILRGSGLTRMYHLVRSISVRLRAVVSLILAMLLFLFAMRLPDTWVTFVLVLVAAVSILAGMRMDFMATEMEEAIQEAVRQEKDGKEEIKSELPPSI